MGKKKVQEMPPSRCKPGQVLGQDLRTSDGRLVMRKGNKLTRNILRRIKSIDVERVPVEVIAEDEKDSSFSDVDTTTSTRNYKQLRDKVNIVNEKLVIQQNLSVEFSADRDIVIQGDINSGAKLTASNNVYITGSLRNGTIKAQNGFVRIENEVTGASGANKNKISAETISVNTVRNCSFTVEGNLIVEDYISNSTVKCDGNLLLHKEDGTAEISDAEIEVNGKMVADSIRGESSNTSLTFENPDETLLEKEKQEYIQDLRSLKNDLTKLEKVVNLTKEENFSMNNLPEKKKKKIRKYLKLYKKRKNKQKRLKSNLESIEKKLKESKNERFYFLRVLNELEAGTQINFKDRNLRLKNNEENVRFFETGTIRVQNAVTGTIDEHPWASNLWKKSKKTLKNQELKTA